MEIAAFAEQHHVRVQRDEGGDTVILGTIWKKQPVTPYNLNRNPERMAKLDYGHRIYDYGDGRFGLLLMFEMDNDHEIGGSGRSAKWANAKKKLVDAGIIRQEGDAEGITLFDPENKAQSRLALKLAGIRVKRQLTEDQRKALANRLVVARENKAEVRKAAA